jgi:methylglutaconyl-CoA hydratase
MITEKIIFEESDGVARLILNRPDKGNAVDLEMMRGIEESLDGLNENKRSRVLVIRGEGDDFCTRLDLGKQGGGVKELHEHYDQVARVNHLLRSFPGVSLTLVQGKTSGFGFGLAAQSDLTIAEENAHFAFPVIRSGQPPTLPISYLGRLIPRKKAFELLIMGKEINAHQAEQFGVVNLVVKAGSLQAEGQAWVSQLLAIEGAALGACKEFFRSTAHLSIEDTAQHGVAFLVNFLAAKKA